VIFSLALFALMTILRIIPGLLLAIALAFGTDAIAHGGVVAEDDLCVIEIGIFRAHFTVYQPETRANKEYCEDIPDVGETIFVLDYMHDSLSEVPVDFRIIRDVNKRTKYATWEDIERMGNLQSATVFYQAPGVYAGESMTAEHVFLEKGWYTGIVTTRHPTRDQTYRAVFGFHVGSRGFGIWPFMGLIILAIQAQYWVSSGGFRRWKSVRDERRGRK
jgi:hypothetical protein